MVENQFNRIKILVFATNWPPERTPRAIHNQRLLAGLSRTHEVKVFVPTSVRSQLPSDDCSLEVFGIYDFKRSLLYRALMKLGVSFNLPDPYVIGFVCSCFRIMWKFKSFKPEVILTISKFDSAHIVGLVFKRFCKVRWVMFMSDPWTDMELFGFIHYSRFQRAINKKLEIWSFAKADRIILTNRSAFKLLKDRIPNNKVATIPQFYDDALVDTILKNSDIRKVGDERIVFRYLGDFYGNRTPLPLLRALELLKDHDPMIFRKILVEFYGKNSCTDRIECLLISSNLGNVHFHAALSYIDSLAVARASDILLVIDADAPFSPFLPSKLVDYLSVRKPIFAIAPPGESYDLTEASGGFVARPNQISDISETLIQIVKLSEEGQLMNHIAPLEFVGQFSSLNVIERFGTLFNSVVTDVRNSRVCRSKI